MTRALLAFLLALVPAFAASVPSSAELTPSELRLTGMEYRIAFSRYECGFDLELRDAHGVWRRVVKKYAQPEFGVVEERVGEKGQPIKTLEREEGQPVKT